MPGCIDGNTLKLADCDLEFLATNTGSRSKLNPVNFLVRHNFMEVFVRMAQTKYTKTKQTKTYGDALRKFLKEYLSKFVEEFDCHKWRKEKLWKEVNDLAFKRGLQTLKEAYKSNIGENTTSPAMNDYMCLQEFEQMIVKAKVFSKNFG